MKTCIRGRSAWRLYAGASVIPSKCWALVSPQWPFCLWEHTTRKKNKTMATKQVLVKTFGESAEYSKAIAIADEIKSIETTDENVTLVAVRLF